MKPTQSVLANAIEGMLAAWAQRFVEALEDDEELAHAELWALEKDLVLLHGMVTDLRGR